MFLGESHLNKLQEPNQHQMHRTKDKAQIDNWISSTNASITSKRILKEENETTLKHRKVELKEHLSMEIKEKVAESKYCV